MAIKVSRFVNLFSAGGLLVSLLLFFYMGPQRMGQFDGMFWIVVFLVILNLVSWAGAYRQELSHYQKRIWQWEELIFFYVGIVMLIVGRISLKEFMADNWHVILGEFILIYTSITWYYGDETAGDVSYREIVCGIVHRLTMFGLLISVIFTFWTEWESTSQTAWMIFGGAILIVLNSLSWKNAYEKDFLERKKKRNRIIYLIIFYGTLSTLIITRIFFIDFIGDDWLMFYIVVTLTGLLVAFGMDFWRKSCRD